ncbi:MAG: hypothetical protein KDE28_26520, partial [Anaerolineales bacterium]|nr:hypothetical protein [Anaerolineales bacterium]
ASQDPFMAAAQWVSPGLAPGDEILIGGKLPMTLERLADLIRSTYFAMVQTAYDDAQGRGETLPPQAQILSVEDLQFHAP